MKNVKQFSLIRTFLIMISVMLASVQASWAQTPSIDDIIESIAYVKSVASDGEIYIDASDLIKIKEEYQNDYICVFEDNYSSRTQEVEIGNTYDFDIYILNLKTGEKLGPRNAEIHIIENSITNYINETSTVPEDKYGFVGEDISFQITPQDGYTLSFDYDSDIFTHTTNESGDLFTIKKADFQAPIKDIYVNILQDGEYKAQQKIKIYIYDVYINEFKYLLSNIGEEFICNKADFYIFGEPKYKNYYSLEVTKVDGPSKLNDNTLNNGDYKQVGENTIKFSIRYNETEIKSITKTIVIDNEPPTSVTLVLSGIEATDADEMPNDFTLDGSIDVYKDQIAFHATNDNAAPVDSISFFIEELNSDGSESGNWIKHIIENEPNQTTTDNTFKQAGKYRLYSYAYDKAGNESEPATKDFVIISSALNKSDNCKIYLSEVSEDNITNELNKYVKKYEILAPSYDKYAESVNTYTVNGEWKISSTNQPIVGASNTPNFSLDDEKENEFKFNVSTNDNISKYYIDDVLTCTVEAKPQIIIQANLSEPTEINELNILVGQTKKIKVTPMFNYSSVENYNFDNIKIVAPDGITYNNTGEVGENEQNSRVFEITATKKVEEGSVIQFSDGDVSNVALNENGINPLLTSIPINTDSVMLILNYKNQTIKPYSYQNYKLADSKDLWAYSIDVTTNDNKFDSPLFVTSPDDNPIRTYSTEGDGTELSIHINNEEYGKLNVYIDRTAPTIAVAVNGGEKKELSNGASVLKIECSYIDKISFSDLTEKSPTTFEYKSRGADYFIPYTNPFSLTKGEYNYTVNATDAAGNTTTNSITIYVKDPLEDITINITGEYEQSLTEIARNATATDKDGNEIEGVVTINTPTDENYIEQHFAIDNNDKLYPYAGTVTLSGTFTPDDDSYAPYTFEQEVTINPKTIKKTFTNTNSDYGIEDKTYDGNASGIPWGSIDVIMNYQNIYNQIGVHTPYNEMYGLDSIAYYSVDGNFEDDNFDIASNFTDAGTYRFEFSLKEENNEPKDNPTKPKYAWPYYNYNLELVNQFDNPDNPSKIVGVGKGPSVFKFVINPYVLQSINLPTDEILMLEGMTTDLKPSANNPLSEQNYNISETFTKFKSSVTPQNSVVSYDDETKTLEAIGTGEATIEFDSNDKNYIFAKNVNKTVNVNVVGEVMVTTTNGDKTQSYTLSEYNNNEGIVWARSITIGAPAGYEDNFNIAFDANNTNEFSTETASNGEELPIYINGTETSKKLKAYIDNTAPSDVIVKVNGEEISENYNIECIGTATLEFAASDQGSGIKYFFYNGNKVAATTNGTAKVEIEPDENLTEIEIWCEDQAGNKSNTRKLNITVKKNVEANVSTYHYTQRIPESLSGVAPSDNDLALDINLNGNTISKITDGNNDITNIFNGNTNSLSANILDFMSVGTHTLHLYIRVNGENYDTGIDLDLTIKGYPVETEQHDINADGFCSGQQALIKLEFLNMKRPPYYNVKNDKGADITNGYVPFQGVDTLPSDYIGWIVFDVTDDFNPGNLKYNITFREDPNMQRESDTAKFDITINYNSKYINLVFDDIACIDNHEDIFAEYQWYHNGELVQGAVQQYIQNIGGLQGTYSAKITTINGETLRVCSATITDNDLSKTATRTINVYPNPASSGTQLTLELVNFDDEDYQNLEIQIVNEMGIQIARITTVEKINYLTLPVGNYTGKAVDTSTGRQKATFKIIVR